MEKIKITTSFNIELESEGSPHPVRPRNLPNSLNFEKNFVSDDLFYKC